jgi:hypothetical protein
MSFLDLLQESEVAVLNSYFHLVKFPKGACILREGDPGEGCYFIDEGEALRMRLTPIQMRWSRARSRLIAPLPNGARSALTHC